MFLNILEFIVENKKKLFRENGFENAALELKKMSNLSTKLLLEKRAKTKN